MPMTETEYLLTCLAEECAEVAQRATKALRFGLLEIQPGKSETNAARIQGELLDLIAIVEMLRERDALPPHIDFAAIAVKKEKVLRFMEYSRECGTLQK